MFARGDGLAWTSISRVSSEFTSSVRCCAHVEYAVTFLSMYATLASRGFPAAVSGGLPEAVGSRARGKSVSVTRGTNFGPPTAYGSLPGAMAMECVRARAVWVSYGDEFSYSVWDTNAYR